MAKVFQTTRALDAASGSVDIAHGMGVTPSFVEIKAVSEYNAVSGVDVNYSVQSLGFADGTDNKCTYICGKSNGKNGPILKETGNSSSNAVLIKIVEFGDDPSRQQVATVSLDGTNITLTWTKEDSGSPTVTNDINLTIIAHS